MMYIHVPMEEYTVNFYTVARLSFMIPLSTFAGMVICEEIQCDYVC